MLNLYRRHQPPCRYTSRRYAIATARSGSKVHYAANTSAERSTCGRGLLRLISSVIGRRQEIGVVKKPDIPTISEAVDLFLADARAQQLSGETIRKYENLLKRRFLPWCESKGYRYLKQLGVEQVRQFRATWSDSANYATKNLERLRALFRFCMHEDWIAKNPARAVKAPRVTDAPTLPFAKPEMGAPRLQV